MWQGKCSMSLYLSHYQLSSEMEFNLIKTYLLIILSLNTFHSMAQKDRLRDLGLEIGVFTPGEYNSITDVPEVSVGHHTITIDDKVRTGVTAIMPHQGNIFQDKVPAAVYVGNGFGKLAGSTQIMELGNLETPIVLTNTLSVPTAVNALITYTLNEEGNEQVRSVNGVVGETNDGRLNDIRGRHVSEQDVLESISKAKSPNFQEGNIGAGNGTVAFGLKGGIGTSSRKLPDEMGAYTIGVLVQTNFGGLLEINGIPVGKELGNIPFKSVLEEDTDGSCMIIVATDAPIDVRNLERLAKRAMLGLAKTGGIASNGSGDYVIAFSNYQSNLVPYQSQKKALSKTHLRNEEMTPFFMATIEATEEAILNSLIAAEGVNSNGYTIKALDIEKLKELIKKYKK